jgi:ribosome biogenesis GTPase / thiamine phosphate phosphatase
MIDVSQFAALRRIGLLPAQIQQVMGLQGEHEGDAAFEHSVLLRVTEVQREGVLLHNGEQDLRGRLRPALRDRLSEQADAVAVGDWVLAQRNALGEWWVHSRLPPMNQLARRLHDGRDKVARVVIVSNVDTALLVMGLDHDFNLRRLERYVALVRLAGVGAVVVLTKRDLCVDVPSRVQAVYSAVQADIPVVWVNALSEEPQTHLAPWFTAGQTLVLLGSSGAGKSTLTNALLGQPVQDTGANRLGDNRGRHTTTTRSLHVTPQGACIIDTPGLRTLRLDAEVRAFTAVFDDISQLAAQCRFRDCQHADEPGCAVRDGVPPLRLRNYQKLLREALRDTQTALQRKTQVQQWKARGRQGRIRADAKRGGGVVD